MLKNKISGKTISLSNLIDPQPDIDKIYLYAKNLYEAKYQLLINKRKKTGIHIWMTLKAFIKYSNDMDDYENMEEYNTNKKLKILIIFDDLIADMLRNKTP